MKRTIKILSLCRSSLFTTAILILIAGTKIRAQQNPTLVFSRLDSLFEYSWQNSTTAHSDEIRFSQAKKNQLLAATSFLDWSANVSLNVTDNTRLPVSYFPAEAFGGTPGTYQEIQTGIPFTNNFNQYAEVKLLNVAGWQNIRLAKINLETVATDNKLSQKSLYENIAVSYYNILTLQQQLTATRENLAAADTLMKIVNDKFSAGIARQQDINDAQVNYLNTQETANQIQFLIRQQTIALKILCDIPDSVSLVLTEGPPAVKNSPAPVVRFNDLNVKTNLLREDYALRAYRQQQLQLLPTVSAFASNSSQQFSNNFSLFDANQNWVNSNYIGLRLTWQIPTSNSISQLSNAKYDYLLAKENYQHAAISAGLQFSQLSVDYEKAVSQCQSNLQIKELQADSYRKNLENYQQGIVNLTQLLNSYNVMVSSNYNYISAQMNVKLMEEKIIINNTIQ